MRLGILSSGTGWHVADLARAATAIGHVAVNIDFRRLSAGVAIVREPLARVDAVIVRTMPPGSLEQVVFRMDLLQRVEARGVPVLNSPRCLETTLKTKEFAPFTSYLGVSGKDFSTRDGVLFQDSRVRFGDISDGMNNTLMLGERPASADLQFGWWYAGIGQAGTGSADLILGVREQNLQPIFSGSPCGPGAYPFSQGGFENPCAMFHFCSPHSGGANFAVADGSVRCLSYAADASMPALASRAGGEIATIPD